MSSAWGSAGNQCTCEKRKAKDAVEGPDTQNYRRRGIQYRVFRHERRVTPLCVVVCRNASKRWAFSGSAFSPRWPYCGRCLPTDVNPHMAVHCRRFDGTSRAAVTLQCHGSVRQHPDSRLVDDDDSLSSAAGASSREYVMAHTKTQLGAGLEVTPTLISHGESPYRARWWPRERLSPRVHSRRGR